ncbi:TetR family transcriptional regulator [Goodfellowiella coeruleoviolacea]|uniref:Transcriptional regulator, TetR family n=1 Tax=Goodfellowiella coeruleoviolacea TaxID=334858 RepID=A0AAE3KFW0_9PSEU|nr:TetR family transcriptional regulator [Goodfellowiella coeruleoviolacea]MCP2165380.1 transcriptional regulator, TetR family [Goodfellowiella coeruleoviolacea]
MSTSAGSPADTVNRGDLAPVPGVPRGGDLPLRERKKLRTRRALADAALRLFTERGFEATTLDQVVGAVEVSKRTFFRNFSCKEEAVLTGETELWGEFVTALADRDLCGMLLTAVGDTLLDTVRSIVEISGDDQWWDRYLRERRLLADTPTLRAYGMVFCANVQREIVSQVGARLGLGPAGDLRLRLLVDQVVVAWRCATEDWITAGGADGAEGVHARLAQALAALPTSLALTAAECTAGVP